VKTLVRKKFWLIPQKSHNNARDYIQYNKYIHSVGHWNNQSIVPTNSWKSNHVRDVVLQKGVGTHSEKQPLWNSFKLILKQNVKKVLERRSHAFPPHYTPEPCTLACRHSTFYQHSQFLKRLLAQRKTKPWKNQEKKFEHKLSQKLQFWHLLHNVIDE